MFGGGRYSLSATPFSVLSHAMIQCEDLGYFWPRIEETLLLSEGATMGDWACRVCFLEQSREGTAGDELACMADGFGALGFGLWGPASMKRASFETRLCPLKDNQLLSRFGPANKGCGLAQLPLLLQAEPVLLKVVSSLHHPSVLPIPLHFCPSHHRIAHRRLC